MPFDMKCNMCGVMLRLQDNQVGSITNCSSCGQVIFVQQPTETAAPEFAPQALAETDTVSSLAEMLESEEPRRCVAATVPDSPMFEPQAEPTESIDLSFLTPKLDTEISLDSAPPAPAVAAPAPVVGGMPWEQPAVESTTAGHTAQSIFEPEQGSVPLSPGPVAGSPPAQPSVPEFPWMAPAGPDEPATAPEPAAFEFSPAAISAQQPTPPATPAAQSAQPEFFLPSAIDETTPAAALTASATMPSTSRDARAAKPASRFGVLAAVYVSGVILGLILGKFMFGRAAATSAGPTGLEVIRDDGVLKDKTKWVDPKASLPSSQLKRLGETVQIAGLSITARSVERAKVTKVHSFGGSRETSAGECLVLHLLLKNTSKDVEFAPLDPMFVRPHNKRERPTYSFIEVPGGEPIAMFDLHKFSEFDLEGQPFDALKPGEEMEAIIAAAEDSPARAKGKMCWRVQVRAGLAEQKPEKKAYTTVVGFEFTPDQIRR